MRKIIDRQQEFWTRVERGKKTECWPWVGTKTKGGYGTWYRTTAHRVAYTELVGPIPPGRIVMHTCDNPPCCNPAHLRLGTQKENLADMFAKGREGDNRNFGEDHGRHKVTDAQVREIRRLYATGKHSQQALAKKFGVWQSQISRIVLGKNRGGR